MRTLEEIIELEGLKTKSKNLKQFFYDKFIRIDKINYTFLNKYPELILYFKNSKKLKLSVLYWTYISEFQKLSEEFIREFKDKVNWHNISENQILSESFIREFQDKVKWSTISKYQNLSESFIEEFQDKLNLYEIEDSWLYKDESFKKDKVIESKMYECHDDHFIAYKGIRSDRYSKFNFQYQYLKGETYTCHADYSIEENSFGLSVWTKEEATNYCDELVVKCKIYYKDVARMVHHNGKIRCSKITILN